MRSQLGADMPSYSHLHEQQSCHVQSNSANVSHSGAGPLLHPRRKFLPHNSSKACNALALSLRKSLSIICLSWVGEVLIKDWADDSQECQAFRPCPGTFYAGKATVIALSQVHERSAQWQLRQPVKLNTGLQLIPKTVILNVILPSRAISTERAAVNVHATTSVAVLCQCNDWPKFWLYVASESACASPYLLKHREMSSKS